MESVQNNDERMFIEIARYLHQTIPAAVLALFFGVMAVAVAYWDSARPGVVAWILLTAPVFIGRIIFWHYWRGGIVTFRQATLVVYGNAWMASAVSCIGGYGTFVILPNGNITQQFIFVCTVVFHNLVTVFSLGVHGPSFALGVVPFAISVLLVIVSGWWSFNSAFVGVYLAFFTAAFVFSKRFRQIFRQSLQLRFENVSLIRRLMEQKDAAESANAAKSRFLAAASHDLRQPMHALEMYLATLARADLPPHVAPILVNAKRCAHTMNDMFGVLLDMSRLDAGTTTRQPEAFAVSDLLARMKLEFEPQAAAKGLKLRVAKCSLNAYTDPALLERILRNLLSNAIRYTHAGGVLLGVLRRRRKFEICVVDTGIGIATPMQSAVFDEYVQVGNPERDRNKGLGLGLAIVKRLAKVLQCEVGLRSVEGKGSVFYVTLPNCQEPTSLPVAQTDESSSGSSDSAGKSGILVWVIDDEHDILDATTVWLCDAGFSVMTADSVDAVQRLLASQASSTGPDIIVCDYRLRGAVNGIQLIYKIRDRCGRNIPAILITGDTGPEAMRDLSQNPFVVLHKPVSPDRLLNELRGQMTIV